jgi:FAD/FMN-containing dehydrogenase
VYGGAVAYPPAQARDVFRLYRDLTSGAPDELTAYAGVQPLATGPAFSIVACWSGDVATGERVLAPLRRLGTPLADTLRAMPYLDMQAIFAVPPVRVGSYARSSFLRDLDDATIDALVARVISPAPPSLIFLEPVHGRASNVGAEESAFSHRGPGYSFSAVALWFEPGEAAAATAWIRDFFGEMMPFLASGVYANYLAGDETDARVRAAYGRSWDRLVALKRKFDPDNFFRLNQNVNPAA